VERLIKPAGTLAGTAITPGDKSISHRALLIASLAPGVSSIEGCSEGRDVLATAQALRNLGISITGSATLRVEGGRDRFHLPEHDLDCGNSGTTIRLLLGLLTGLGLRAVLVGDSSLSGRPMDRVKVPLELMGAQVHGQGARCLPPVQVSRSGALRGIDYTLPEPSAQVKSAILLAGLFADTHTVVREHSATRAHTEEMFADAGISIATTTAETIDTTLTPGVPQARHWLIPGDPSQAAFFVVAGLLGEGARVSVANLYAGPGRSGFLAVLSRMGGCIDTTPSEVSMSVTASHSPLAATEIFSHEIPSLDEVPILAVAACAATGTTVFRNLAELRVKESDRYAASASLARSLGAGVEERGDDLAITGLGSARHFSSIELDPHGDHRMAMSAAIAGVVGQGCRLVDAACIETSFPDFFNQLSALS
jgi:3-phosphoshikimate 1-carboxyvinyltransferase